MEKRKMFTHTDMDGVGCAILAKLAFDEVDIEYCDYTNINEKVKEFLDTKEYLKYSHVYITDISINKELADIIQNTAPKEFKGFNLCEHFTLIDHHPTSKHLEDYWWCNITTENKLGLCSGTSLLYDFILDIAEYPKLFTSKGVKQFVETVRQYDSWDWHNKYNNPIPNTWNSLLYIYGREIFINKIIKKLVNIKEHEFDFDEMDLTLIKLDKNKKKNYFEKKSKEMNTSFCLQGYKVGVVFAEQYISELGNHLAEKHPNLDFIILIGSQTISYRGIKDDIDLGAIAKQFGGGGHPKASGSQIDTKKQMNYIQSLFN